MKNNMKLISMLITLMMVLTFFAGCGAQQAEQAPTTQAPAVETTAETPATGEAPAELTKVRLGLTPYPMYPLYSIAKELGIDKEFGLDIETKVFTGTATAAQALTRGDMDITSSCIAEHLAAVKGSPSITNFTPLGNFKGFFFVGREKDFTPWEELVAKVGVEAAKVQRLNEYKGKTFCIIPQRKPLIVDALNQVGLTEKDVKFMNFADDAKAATALLSGTGDIYIGSLPQQRAITQEKGYVNVGGAEILGPAGLWFDTMTSTDDFMTKHRETALRMLAVQFATVAEFDRDTDNIAKIGSKYHTQNSSIDTPPEEWKLFMTKFDDYVSLEEAKEGFYNPESKLYWKIAVEYNINALIADGTLDKGTSPDKYFGESEKLFNELLQRQDLLDMIAKHK
jgi:ABC-type nitrate/sulfonate/bicarbonate transport system substrate-binding protein